LEETIKNVICVHNEYIITISNITVQGIGLLEE